MRIGLVAIAALLLGSTSSRAADPPLPPIVFQTQPVGKILNDLRDGARIIAGEKAVQLLNEEIKRSLGEKGLEGLDIGRPFVGYVVLAPKPEDITAVIAFPITGEKEFLELCDRVNKDKLRVDSKDKTLYHMPPLNPRYKAVMRFHERYAYIAYGFNPMPHIDPKALVSMPKLFDPDEKGLISARLHFDRVPLPVKLALPALMEEVKKTLEISTPISSDPEMAAIAKAVTGEFEKLLTRYAKLAGGADTMVARLFLDQAGGNVVVEAALSGKPDSEIAKQIAAFKPTMNRFAALAEHKETVGAFQLRVPLYEEELRTAGALGIEAAQKQMMKNPPPVGKAAVEELFKGLVRTIRAGEVDIVAAVRGPDKQGQYTAVGAFGFADPSKLEKEFKIYIEKEAEREIADAIKWDVATVGKTGIHTWKVLPGGFIDVTKVFGGDNCVVAFAFAPHGIFAAMGADAVGTLKEALAVKPAPAPVFDLVVNPVRAAKLIRQVVGEDDPDLVNIEDILGKEDKLLSALSATLVGGKELKATITLNLKLIPRAAIYSTIRRAEQQKNVIPGNPIK